MKARVPIEQEKAKRRKEVAVALASAVLIAIIFTVESEIARSTEGIPYGGHLLLFGLLSVVTLLLILLFFFLTRNLFKLVFERRQRLLGSRLKTRLTVAFVALTLVPTVVLFIASAGVLHTTIESWFTSQVEDSLQSSLVIAQAYYKNSSEQVLNAATRFAEAVAQRPLLEPENREALKAFLEAGRSADGLGSVQMFFGDDSPPLVFKNPQLNETAIPVPMPSFLKIAFQGEKTSQIIPIEGGAELIRGIVPVRSAGEDGVRAALVVDLYIPTSLAGRLIAISNAFDDYQEAKRMKGPVKTFYVLVLLLVALLVIFIGFWFGMSMAREMTDPLLSLSEGTAKIAAGDLDVYVEPVGDDELAVLVRSFNKMAADLRKNREELVRVNLDLDGRRKYMETVLANVASGVLALDSAGNVTTVNNSARGLLGIKAEEPVGNALSDVLPETAATHVAEILEDLGEAQSNAVERQFTVRHEDRALSLICFANSLRDEEGRDLGRVMVFEDMTYLIKAQRMAAWREVARRIAHEIKNPLTPIQLNSQRLRRKYLDKLGEDALVLDQCTRAIIDQVEQLKTMVNEFSRFARMPAATPVAGDLNELIREVVELYRPGRDGIEFSFQPDPSLPIFAVDPAQMKRAVMNLLDNAVAASRGQGRVTVTTGYAPDLAMASIEVADAGTGIDPADRDRLFEPYFSRKPGGTGLGLSIVSAIIADHNGFIRVRDNTDGGARFIIELPVRKS